MPPRRPPRHLNVALRTINTTSSRRHVVRRLRYPLNLHKGVCVTQNIRRNGVNVTHYRRNLLKRGNGTTHLFRHINIRGNVLVIRPTRLTSNTNTMRRNLKGNNLTTIRVNRGTSSRLLILLFRTTTPLRYTNSRHDDSRQRTRRRVKRRTTVNTLLKFRLLGKSSLLVHVISSKTNKISLFLPLTRPLGFLRRVISNRTVRPRMIRPNPSRRRRTTRGTQNLPSNGHTVTSVTLPRRRRRNRGKNTNRNLVWGKIRRMTFMRQNRFLRNTLLVSASAFCYVVFL